ncbi:hypothetical protein [Rhizobium sp. S163]|uniref:hypothetical protein n=1 Tax=Rhizobium sp. S163 TaxID=3055039 RepID=UPI0025A9F8A9|nr:hypothetical protein [Rhizobium sp. S163]MDM9646696.1 hypothetical protein [Rhizobium sp. S163]
MPDIVIWPDYPVPALNQRGIMGNHIGERAAVDPEDTSVTEMSVACEVYHKEEMELIGCAPSGCAEGKVTLIPKGAKRNLPKFDASSRSSLSGPSDWLLIAHDEASL